MFSVIDHLFCHAAVDADIFAGDETRLVRAEEEHHVGDVHRVAHAACGVLRGVRALVFRAGGVDPSGGYGIDADPPCKAYGERVRERRDAALGRGVAFRLRLAHPVAA